MILKRITRVYLILGQVFGSWFSPIISGCLILILRVLVGFFRLLDYVFYPKLLKPIKNNPIIIVGNPRSGTTFLHRFLIKLNLGSGSQLWQMIYPSIILQKIIKPFLPIMETISPARHHSTAAHKTSLTGIETDDVSLLFRYFDGFFLYGFFLTFDKNNLFDWVDPKVRNTSNRDYKWFTSMWKRNLISNKHDQYIGKLFSLSGNLPEFQKRFPNSKILYMIRDPLNLIPSGLSLVTGVLDKKFNFWSLDKKVKERFIKRLYNALVQLMNRFQDDWVKGNINKKNVYLVNFNSMMNDFETLMNEILEFIDVEKKHNLAEIIRKTAENQKSYKSKHKYDLSKFGLSEDQIRKDCINYYKTFLK